MRYGTFARSMLFQSTHPVRGATQILTQLDTQIKISIHAPREGCDRHVA